MTCGAESPLAQVWLPWTHCMLGPAGIGMSAACRPEEVVCGYDESLGVAPVGLSAELAEFQQQTASSFYLLEQSDCVQPNSERFRFRIPRCTASAARECCPLTQLLLLQRTSRACRRDPPQVGSGKELQQWMCRVHNTVNRSLNKPMFNCELVSARWAPLSCEQDEGASACDMGNWGLPK